MRAWIVSGFLVAFALAADPAAAASLAPTAEAALVPFHAFVDGVNKGDSKTAAAAFAPDSVIVDEFAPFLWRGKAFDEWFSAFGTWAKANGVEGAQIGISPPSEFVPGTDAAYAVIPAHLTFTQNGKPASEDGTFSVALKRYKRGWRISAWAWATKPTAP